MKALDSEIAALAIPASLALATDPLYDLCDTAVLGHIGTSQLGGAALASRLLALGYAVFVFLMFGTTAAVARLRGAGEQRRAAEQGVGAVWLALGLGAVAVPVFAVIGRPAIALLGGTGAVADHAWTYLWVSLAGLPAFMIVMVGVGFHRGGRDTRTPLRIAMASVSLNLVLELVAVFGLGFGVGASALATVIAKWASAAVYLVLIARDVRGVGASWRPDLAAIRSQLRVGGDLVVRTLVLLSVLTSAQALAARLGTSNLAAHAIAFQIWIFAAYGVDGIEAAGQSLVAHRLGEGSTEGAEEVAQRLLRWSVLVGVGLGIVIALTSRLIPHVFSPDRAVVAEAATTLLWVAALQPVNAVAFSIDGILVGASQQRYLARAMVVAGLAYAVVAIVAVRVDRGLGGIWAAISAFMVIRCALGNRRLRQGFGSQS